MISMATTAEITAIAASLIEKTMAHTLDWSASEDAYEYEALSGRFVYYVKSRDEDDRAPYRLQIVLRTEGEEDQPILAEAGTISGTNSTATLKLNSALRDLYDVAKLTALGVGTSLADEVLKDLGVE